MRRWEVRNMGGNPSVEGCAHIAITGTHSAQLLILSLALCSPISISFTLLCSKILLTSLIWLFSSLKLLVDLCSFYSFSTILVGFGKTADINWWNFFTNQCGTKLFLAVSSGKALRRITIWSGPLKMSKTGWTTELKEYLKRKNGRFKTYMTSSQTLQRSLSFFVSQYWNSTRGPILKTVQLLKH